MNPAPNVLCACMLTPLAMGAAQAAPAGTIVDKTLVVWASPSTLDQAGGSALTLDDMASRFDGIVFGELRPSTWMAGSDLHRRTQTDQTEYPVEADAALVQIAIAYRGSQVSLYRNGELVAEYTFEGEPQAFGPGSVVMIGKRHVDTTDARAFAGAIDDARIYDTALDADTIASLRPNEPVDALTGPRPWAWWSFEDGIAGDGMGTFDSTLLIGGARIQGGQLILDGDTGTMVALPRGLAARWLADQSRAAGMGGMIDASRDFRLQLLEDPHRPAYHFAAPEGYCFPFDPNGAIFWNGRYHLCYIYQDGGVHHWGHVSSTDLLHWRHHPPALTVAPGDPDRGIFSGNCFINKDGQATILYHGLEVGNCIATSSDTQLDTWTKLSSNPIVPHPPADAPFSSWDPHGWLEGDTYYAIFGGTRASIFKARTLDDWEYVGDLLAHTVEGVDLREDISCADFFRLGDKHVLVCISHRLGCRYFTGEWRDEQFYPEVHERMSWVDNAYFAPESLVDDRGRRIMWAWIFDGRTEKTYRRSGWSGTMSLPRVLTLRDDGRLGMEPIEELDRLRYNGVTVGDVDVPSDGLVLLEDVQGSCIEIDLEMASDAPRFGLEVCRSPRGEERTRVYYDREAGELAIDTRASSLGEGPKSVEAGPLELGPGEALELRVYIDKSVVEVFANGRQAVMRRIYPTRADSVGVALFAEGGAATARGVRSWEMMPSNPY
ncbi:MAG: hypothetical protein GF320_16650 [Armatimonadia bacterium]|nr:hypothetical protein [Armatimonadia bacterium]